MDTAITGHTITRGGAQAPPSLVFRLSNPGLANLLVVGGSRLSRERTALSFHTAGRLRLGPFVAVRAGEVDWVPILFDALSGARSIDRTSPLARAEGGTLFVDEIDLLERDAQRLLLEFLERGRSQGSRDSGWAGLLAAGSRRDLKRAVVGGGFFAPLLDALDKIRIDLLPETSPCPAPFASTSC